MSYFLFGAADALAAAAGLADCITLRAKVCGLSLVRGEAIRQPPVVQMMKEHGADRPGMFTFLLVGSAGEDTSGEILGVSVEPHLRRDALASGLARVDRWLLEIGANCAVARVRLFLTEGYDVGFESVKVRAGEFAAAIASRVDESLCIPSLLIDVTY